MVSPHAFFLHLFIFQFFTEGLISLWILNILLGVVVEEPKHLHRVSKLGLMADK